MTIFPIKHKDGSQDNRYQISKECCGREEQAYVLRWCGDYVATSDHTTDLEAIARHHNQARKKEGLKLELEQVCVSEDADYPETLNVLITPEIQAQILKARGLVMGNSEIANITLFAPDDMIQISEEAYKACPYDVSRIQVYAGQFVVYLQGKYDCHVQAEYGTSYADLEERNQCKN